MTDDIRTLLVETFNIDLAEIGSAARVAIPAGSELTEMLDLLAEDGAILCAIPADTAPRMIAIAFELHRAAFEQGSVAGEAAAWAKLRALIGAAAG